MSLDILAGNIREKLLVSILFTIDDHAVLVVGVSRDAKEEAEFEGHVESRQPAGSSQLGSGDVVVSEAALIDNASDLRESNLCCVSDFKSRPCNEPQSKTANTTASKIRL